MQITLIKLFIKIGDDTRINLGSVNFGKFEKKCMGKSECNNAEGFMFNQ